MVVQFLRVGGAVRDQLLGLQPEDVDFIVPGVASAAELASVVQERGGSWDRNLANLNQGLAAQCALKAKWQNLGVCDFVGCQNVIKELERRDFSINAIAQNEDGELIDPFNGVADLNNRIIRCVGNPIEKFLADPSRVIRSLRLAIQFDFEIDQSIWEASLNASVIEAVVQLIDILPALKRRGFQTYLRFV